MKQHSLDHSVKDATRFWNKVDTSGGQGACWFWTAGLRSGYGVVKLRGRTVSAHRAAWELHHCATILRGYSVLHSCDTRQCCNPRHLRLGTHKENSADAVSRARTARGTQNGFYTAPERRSHDAKLTVSQVKEIRWLYYWGNSCRALAAEFGINRSGIYKLVWGKSWAHVARPLVPRPPKPTMLPRFAA